MKVLRGRVIRVAGFLVSVRVADASELTLDCGLAFTAFKAGDAVTLFQRNRRIIRAVCERTGLMIRLDAINDLEQTLPKADIVKGVVPLWGARSALSYWQHCWARRQQGRWGWQLWCLPSVLAMLATGLLLASLPDEGLVSQLGWAIAFGFAGSLFVAALWPGVLMIPHVLIERIRAAITDRSAQRALADAPDVDWSSEALSLPQESDQAAPLDMSFLDQPVEPALTAMESPSPAASELKVVPLSSARAMERLTALSEKAVAIQALCDDLVQEHQAIRGELLSSPQTPNRDRPERRARI